MRVDGLVPGEPFFVIQFFDREGYFGSCIDPTLEGVREKARVRTVDQKFVYATQPFQGEWASENLPNVTAPAEWKDDLQLVEKSD